jgi:dCMP deaminase
MAKLAASRSTCISRPTGAIIVKDNQIVATGYNGALPGQNDCLNDGKCFRRSVEWPEANKYDMCRSSHSESNAISLAAKKGVSVEGATIYCTLEPCINCAKLIIMSGIKRVVFEYAYESPIPERDKYWREVLSQSNVLVEKMTSVNRYEILYYVKEFIDPETSKRKL